MDSSDTTIAAMQAFSEAASALTVDCENLSRRLGRMAQTIQVIGKRMHDERLGRTRELGRVN